MSTRHFDAIYSMGMSDELKPMEEGSKTKSRLECHHRNLGGETKKGNQLCITESLGIYMASPSSTNRLLVYTYPIISI